ncbi:UPF0669 protein v1g209471-like [Ciona intestinalis]
MTSVVLRKLIFTLTGLLFLLSNALGNDLIHVQTFYGYVGAENFTYFRLTLEGDVVVKLHSHEGDADLYLSTETEKPTWEDYTMKSDTCSEDIVSVQSFQPRPIGIGVYGYIHHYKSSFSLSVYLDPQSKSHPDDLKAKVPLKPSKQNPDSELVYEEQEDSILWTIFVGFLRFLLDVLL